MLCSSLESASDELAAFMAPDRVGAEPPQWPLPELMDRYERAGGRYPVCPIGVQAK